MIWLNMCSGVESFCHCDLWRVYFIENSNFIESTWAHGYSVCYWTLCRFDFNATKKIKNINNYLFFQGIVSINWVNINYVLFIDHTTTFDRFASMCHFFLLSLFTLSLSFFLSISAIAYFIQSLSDCRAHCFLHLFRSELYLPGTNANSLFAFESVPVQASMTTQTLPYV